MNISFEFHCPSSIHWIHLKFFFFLHLTLGIWCSHPPFLHHCFEIQKMLKHFTLVFHEVDPHLLYVVMNETHVVLASYNEFLVFMVHTFEWIIYKDLKLTWVFWAGNGCLTYFPNWNVSQTSEITSSNPNLQRLPTSFCFSINLTRWRLTWPTCLCQNPMFPAPFPCVNNMKFTSNMFTSKVNIRPILFPFAINLLWFFMFSIKHPLGWMSHVNLVPPSSLLSLDFLLWLNIKYIFQVFCLAILHGQSHLVNFCDGMCNVITNFHKPWCFQIPCVSKPFFMISHVVWRCRNNIQDIVIW